VELDAVEAGMRRLSEELDRTRKREPRVIPNSVAKARVSCTAVHK
jgi:hypothetical protein